MVMFKTIFMVERYSCQVQELPYPVAFELQDSCLLCHFLKKSPEPGTRIDYHRQAGETAL